jgi:hypothetical protein
MLITAPYGSKITWGCGHNSPYGGDWANDVGEDGNPTGVPIYLNGAGSPEGLMAYVYNLGSGITCKDDDDPYAGSVARADVFEYALGQWFSMGSIWYAHIENIQTGWKGLGYQIGTVSTGTVSGC